MIVVELSYRLLAIARSAGGRAQSKVPNNADNRYIQSILTRNPEGGLSIGVTA